ncbi:MAG: helix-turn-helix domain-containing protein [Patescibacteria group bacterium]|jgi:cytoskeletal protein RodZ
MAEFTAKDIRSIKTLGERLRAIRTEAGIELADASSATGIQKSYLAALEEGRYDRLPGEMYARNFLKSYAEYLELNPASVFRLYEKERQVDRSQRQPSNTPLLPQRISAHSLAITPKIVRRLAIALVILACFAYLGYVIYKSISPPLLTIDTPTDNLITTQSVLDISGHVEPESQLQINGREVVSDQNGAFHDTVTLQEGLNIITLEAVKKRSKPTIIYRKVLLNK